MPSMKFKAFRGTTPKISPELIQELSAQTALNCKLYSGDLIPFKQPSVIANHGRSGVVRTLHALRDPDTDDLVFMSWPQVVDIATPSFSGDGDQRFYYTGDGVPKVSTYDMAVGLTTPYPSAYYELGLPLPEQQLTATPTAFSTKTVSSFARSSAAEATIVTSANHGLRTGATVAISGFSYRAGTYNQAASTTITVTLVNHGLATGAYATLDFTSGTAVDGTYQVTVIDADTFTIISPDSATTSGVVRFDISDFNVPAATINVTAPNTFTYTSPGPAITTTSSSGGSVDLASSSVERFYIFTWYTPWGEESIGSEPSESVIMKEGQSVTVTGFPTTNPASPESGLQTTNAIRGVRVYRTVSGTSDTEYFLLKTLWFPTATATIARASNIATVRLAHPHNFISEDRFKISGCSDPSFDATDALVIDVIDEYTFTYASPGSALATTANTTGTVYYDAAFSSDDTARYWGDGSYSFTDDFDPNVLTEILESTEYAPPPEGLTGLKVMNSDTLVGFVGNRLYFSEPGKPHAWPEQYQITLEHDIIGVEPVSSVGVFVMTERYPYLLTGTDPGALAPQRIDALYPCVSARGIVPMSYGVVYPSFEGLVAFSGSNGISIATKAIHTADTWTEAIDVNNIVGTFYGDQYFGSDGTTSFFFEQDEQGGYIVNSDETFTATWYDALNDELYYTRGTAGDVYKWDDQSQPAMTMQWKSKVMVFPEYCNLGAARIIADYATTSENWEDIDVNWENYDVLWDASQPITFKLWVDKTLIFEREVFTGLPFRLPTGYLSDTFEISVEGDVRIRSIHLAETVNGLKAA